MLDPTPVSRNQLQVQLKAKMLKSRVINEGMQTGVGAHAGGRGAGGKSLRAHTSRPRGRACATTGWGTDTAGVDLRHLGIIVSLDSLQRPPILLQRVCFHGLGIECPKFDHTCV
jgi:hypothetical protein